MSDLESDPQEKDPKLGPIIRAAGKEAEKIIAASGFKGMGACHGIWGEQKRILKEKHNIDWKSPAEMNPLVRFD